MKLAHICAGADPDSTQNDDRIVVFTSTNRTDIIVIDGATSVAHRNYIDDNQGDVAWFVHAFTDAVEKALTPERSQEDCVWLAIAAVRAQFRHAAADRDIPLHAWPIAAMTWLRLSEQEGAVQAALYSLGDCKTLLHTISAGCIDLDPFVNPQEAVLKDAIAALTNDGVDDPACRRERMLPMLRARREFQNTTPAPGVLCLEPRGPFQARTRNTTLAHDASLLVMTDGFYRLVDTYSIYTDTTLMEACLDRGLAAQLDELRKFESTGVSTGAASVKPADDASAVLWTAA
ncbi:hypothetical protein RCH14_002857 [Massilia sp. MP_M2]|uniref:hypothetical protein n=1 Tax=Massilia sp. MP_M2 TaxID=3071713 RepID=UPI00319DC620